MKTRLLFVSAYFVLIHLGTSLVLKRTIEGPNCQKFQELKNGIIHQSHGGGVLNFHCLANYVLEGPKQAFCVDGKWNTPMPSCLPPNVTPSLSCDFETADLCGWTQDLNQNFDWTRRMYSVHLSTGPSYDHTKGPGRNGYFMYFDGSTSNINDKARLISPTYTRGDTNDICLEFYYHMYGSGIGLLRAYAVKANETWDLRFENQIFVREGNQEDRWWYAIIYLPWLDDQFQVIFEGVRSHSDRSDIAIDNVRISENCDRDSYLLSFFAFYIEPNTGTSIYESCNNRCNTNNTQDISCSCDEDCFENNFCCLDYFEFCVLASDSYVTESTSEDYVTEYEDTTVHILPTEKEFPTVIQKEYHPVLPDKTVPTQKKHVPDKGTVVAVLTVCFIVVGILGLVFLAKRYISRNWMCVRRRRSENGDRKNEVRFLTGDEVLGIRLQLPHSEN